MPWGYTQHTFRSGELTPEDAYALSRLSELMARLQLQGHFIGAQVFHDAAGSLNCTPVGFLISLIAKGG
jgi:hypothetical protein